MKALLLVGALLALVGCAGEKHTLKVQGFEKQVLAFETAADTAGLAFKVYDLIIEFYEGLAKEGENGRCYLTKNTPTIYINPFFWETASEDKKELVVLHEMAHCVLHQMEHRNSLNEDGQPTSILNKSVVNFSEAYYELYKARYYTELFQ